MDLYDPSARYAAAATHRQDVYDVIRDWRYLAAHKVAADERHERAIAEAAQSRRLAATGAGSDWWLLFTGMRQCVGEALVAVGMKLQVMSQTGQTVATPARRSAPS